MKRIIFGKKIMIALVGIAVIIALVGLYAYHSYNQLFIRMYEPLEASPPPPLIGNAVAQSDDATAPKQEEQATISPFTMLLIGIDARGEEHARSDSLFVAVVHPEEQRLSLIPIPRDLYVNVDGHGMEKVNHAMFFGGVPLLKKTLEDYLGIPMQRYITVDFEGFRRIIDEIGGVTVDVKKRMKYTDRADGTNINLQKGVQVLDGKKALDYARYRRSDIARDETDGERTGRQMELIKAILEQGKEKFSIFRILTFMDITGEHVKTDLSKKEIKALVPRYKNFSTDDIQTTGIAGIGKRLPYGNTRLFFYVVTDEEKARIRTYIQEHLQ